MVNSAQNFIFVALAARTSTLEEFGALSVCLAILLLVQTFSQAVVGESSLIKLAHDSTGASSLPGAMYLLTATIGILAAVLALSASLLFDSTLNRFLTVLGVGIAAVLLQDFSRFVLMGMNRRSEALLVDSTWILCWVGCLSFAHNPQAADHFLFWAVSCYPSVVVGIVLIRPKFDLKNVRADLLAIHRLSRTLVSEWACLYASSQLSILALSTLLGLGAVAGLRAAETIFGPLNVLINAIRLVYTTEVPARAEKYGWHDAGRLGAKISAGATMLTGVICALVFLMPSNVGTLIFGQSWYAAIPVLLLVSANRLAISTAIGPTVFLRGAGLVSESARPKMLGAVGGSISAIAIAPYSGIVGAIGMFVAGNVLTAATIWRAQRNALNMLVSHSTQLSMGRRSPSRPIPRHRAPREIQNRNYNHVRLSLRRVSDSDEAAEVATELPWAGRRRWP